MGAFKKCRNLVPTWEVEDFILQKSKYMQACIDAGVPMAPTFFVRRGHRSPAGLLRDIKSRGWRTFVLKQSESGFSLGFFKCTVAACESDPSILIDYFHKFSHVSEYIVQEAIEGFTRNWETRCFWYNGKFLYAIANMAAVSSPTGAEKIITGDSIPKEFLENAKRIGAAAIKCLPKLRAPNGRPVGMTLMRTDIGCSDSQIFDHNTNWDPKKKTFFLNEIEPSSTTYFVRHLKFDCIPLYGKLIAETAQEIHREMGKTAIPVLKPLAMRSVPMKAAVTAKKVKVMKTAMNTKVIKSAMKPTKAMKTKAMKAANKAKVTK